MLKEEPFANDLGVLRENLEEMLMDMEDIHELEQQTEERYDNIN